MGKKIIYHKGENIGPHKDIIFLEELSSTPRRRAVFHCNKCNTDFESDISEVKRGTRGCHCSKINNLLGKHFGRLTVVHFAGINEKTRQSLWEVECSCDKRSHFIVSGNSLITGNTVSCGCKKEDTLIHKAEEEMLGQTFGKLTVLSLVPNKRKNGTYVWKCRCSCPEHNIIEADSHSLKRFQISSCGCLTSKGEALIQRILTNLNIEYKKEQSFENCINPDTNKKLRFDFYLPKYNCCIEYDGKQHFECSCNGWNTLEKFQKRQQRDNIKNQYCKDNNILLIRIPYTDFDILNEKYIINRLK